MNEYIIPTAHDLEVLAVKAQIKMSDVCRQAGVAPNTFSRWKHGKMTPSIDTVQKLLNVLQPEITGVPI